MDKERIALLREISERHLAGLRDELARNGYDGDMNFRYALKDGMVILNSLYLLRGHPELAK